MMTVGPAGVLGVPKGALGVGADADVTIIDHTSNWTVRVDDFRSKSRNCPYDGWELNARAAYTIVGGCVKHRLDA